jgi:hypothetical protein
LLIKNTNSTIIRTQRTLLKTNEYILKQCTNSTKLQNYKTGIIGMDSDNYITITPAVYFNLLRKKLPTGWIIENGYIKLPTQKAVRYAKYAMKQWGVKNYNDNTKDIELIKEILLLYTWASKKEYKEDKQVEQLRNVSIEVCGKSFYQLLSESPEQLHLIRKYLIKQNQQ